MRRAPSPAAPQHSRHPACFSADAAAARPWIITRKQMSAGRIGSSARVRPEQARALALRQPLARRRCAGRDLERLPGAPGPCLEAPEGRGGPHCVGGEGCSTADPCKPARRLGDRPSHRFRRLRRAGLRCPTWCPSRHSPRTAYHAAIRSRSKALRPDSRVTARASRRIGSTPERRANAARCRFC